MSSIKFSIIVPVYQVESELPRCVDSLINQSYENIEIILVDDGSRDCCPKMCDEYAERDKRIRVVHKENGGLSDARNSGLSVASGEYVLFVDSDDYIKSDSCVRLLNVCDGIIDIIVGEAEIYHGDRIEWQGHTNILPGVYSNQEYIIESVKNNEWYAPVCYNCYRREFLIENGLFFRKGIFHEDMEYLPRAFLAAKKVGYVNHPFYQYVLRDNSITQKGDQSKNLHDLFCIYAEWKHMFDEVENGELRDYLYASLAKHCVATCRKYRLSKRVYPDGINATFLFVYTKGFMNRIKMMAFILFRQIYVKM